VTAPVQQTDHAGVAQGLLPGQFINSTNLRALVEALVGVSNPVTWTIQELEDTLFDLLNNRWLSTAVGEQLDKMGEVLGESRLSAVDAEYRDALYLRVLINVSEGEPERLIEVLDRLADPAAVHLTQKPPAAVYLVAITMTKDDILGRTQEAALAGVLVIVAGGTGVNPFIMGRARDAAGAQLGVAHPAGGLGYGVPGTPGTGGEYVALYVL